MKTLRVFVMLILLAVTLACYATASYKDGADTKIISVSVDPPSGSGTFTLKVSYEAFQRYLTGMLPPSVVCTYTTPDLATMPIGQTNPQVTTENVWLPFTDTFFFNVTQSDGRTPPGVYIAGCTTTDGGSQPVTASFTVVEAQATEPPSLPATEPVQPPPPANPPVQLPLVGKIIFDYNGYQSGRPSGGGELDWVTQWCIPRVTISTTGAVSGSCEYSGTTTHLTQASVTAQVTGSVDASGNVTFSYDVSEIGSPNGAWRISYEGNGKFTSLTQASGTADFSYSCSSGQDNLLWCYPSTTYESFSGSVPWSFVPSQ